MKNMVEAELRRNLVGCKVADGGLKIGVMGWTCRCGEELAGNDTEVMKCTGCEGLVFGKPDPKVTRDREAALDEASSAWT